MGLRVSSVALLDRILQNRTMSEVSQLNEMNTVLIASKEDNDKKRHEAHQMAAKIAELEVSHVCTGHTNELLPSYTIVHHTSYQGVLLRRSTITLTLLSYRHTTHSLHKHRMHQLKL